MSENIQAAGFLIKLNNKTEYMLYPLSDQKIEEMNIRIRGKLLDTAKQVCEGVQNTSFISATMGEAMKQAQEIDWMMDPNVLHTVDNMTYLLWLGVRKEDDTPMFSLFKKVFMENWEANFTIGMEAMKKVNPTLLGESPAEKK